jgi:hypothetical protein
MNTNRGSFFELKTIEKKNFDIFFTNFKQHIIKDFSIENLINSSFICEVDSLNIRIILWKMFLGILPINNDIYEWVSHTQESRNFYKSKKKETRRLKNYSADPLQKNKKVTLKIILKS